MTIEEIADYLHSKECHSDHTDQCGWYYEKWEEKLGWARRRYWKRAKRIKEYADKHNIDVKYLLSIWYFIEGDSK